MDTLVLTRDDMIDNGEVTISDVNTPVTTNDGDYFHIYLGISATSVCEIDLEFTEGYPDYEDHMYFERLTSQTNMYALHLELESYLRNYGDPEYREFDFSITAHTCGELTREAEFTINQKGCENTCTITWKDDTGTVTLETDEGQVYGTETSYDGATPTKTPTAQSAYTFDGWSTSAGGAKAYNDGETPDATGDATYYAHFVGEPQKYTVWWKNDDGTVTLETDSDLLYNTPTSYDGTRPKKTSTPQSAYTFNGWAITPNGAREYSDGATPPVTANTTYYAYFASETIKYKVFWRDDTGSVNLETDTGLPWGSPTSYGGATPTKAPTAQSAYTFDGWSTSAGGAKAYNDGETPNLTGDTTYYAHFASETRKYTVWWKNDDGTVTLETDSNQPYGTPTSCSATPSKDQTPQSAYTFNGWAITPNGAKVYDTGATPVVTANTTYYAHFTGQTRSYDIFWKNWDGSLITQGTALYGETPSYGGSEPIRADSGGYRYIFAGWNPIPGPITGMTIYTAQFSKHETRTVSFIVPKPDDTEPSLSARPDTIASQTILYRERATEPTPPVAVRSVGGDEEVDERYECVGWKYDNDGTWENWNFNNRVYDNITLYAIWDYQVCSAITYLTINGDDISNPSTANYGDGVHFMSWSHDSDKNIGVIKCDNCIEKIDRTGAFESDGDFYEVRIPDTLVEIGDEIFQECYNFRKIDARNVEKLGIHSFEGCAFYAILVDDGTTASKNKIDYYNDMGGCIVLSDALNESDRSVFEHCNNAIEAEIPGSLEVIPQEFIKECKNLKKVTIKSGVTVIGEEAFAYNSKLSAVTIPSTVTEIGPRAFSYDTDLDLTIPTNVTSIHQSSLYMVPNVNYSGSSAHSPWGARSVNGYVEGMLVYDTSAKRTLRACRSSATGVITIPSSVTTIQPNAFYDCTNLTSVSIPSTVTSIGSNAFYNVLNIRYSGSATGSPWGARNVNLQADGYCLYNEDFTEVNKCNTAASGVVTIRNGATRINNTAFSGCTGITSIVIPNSVTGIGTSAFTQCDGLISVSIGSGVTNIEQAAFYSCDSLTSVTIPDSVSVIGNYAFEICGLLSIVIGSGVTSIGWSSFGSNYNLSVVTCYATTPPVIKNNTFEMIAGNCTLKVPASAVNAYRSAQYWSSFTNIEAI